MLTVMQLSASQVAEMRQQVESLAPEEACGLLGGSVMENIYQVNEVIPVSNVLHSPERYQMDAEEQWMAFQRFESLGKELVGIYHSHPRGPAEPSATDRAEAYYPEAVYLIWSRAAVDSSQPGEWQYQAFILRSGLVQSVVLQVE